MKTNVLAYGNYTCPAGWHSFDDGGAFHKVYFMRGGSVVYHDDRGDVPLRAGHLYVFPMYRRYHITHDPKDPLRVEWLHVDCCIPVTFELLDVPVSPDTLESRLLALLAEAMEKKPRLLPDLAGALMEAVREYGDVPVVQDERVARMLSLLSGENGISNRELAARVGYNESYMIRLFRAHLGVTPHKYVMRMRMNRARRLLLDGHSIAETSQRLGFPNPNAFSRDFSKTYGFTPTRCIQNGIQA